MATQAPPLEAPTHHGFAPPPPEPITPAACPDVAAAVVRCPTPRLCGSAAEHFFRMALAGCPSGTPVVIDLDGVTVIDAAGLLGLARCVRAVRATGGVPRLCGPTPPVRALLAAAGLHAVVEVFHTRAQAVQACRAEIVD